jgi:hypothetical protein
MRTSEDRRASKPPFAANRAKWPAVCSAAVLCALAATPAAADPLSDLKAQVQQMQEQIQQMQAKQEKDAAAAVAKADVVKKDAAGSFPGSFKIPGTNTSMKFGGYVKADFLHDMKQNVGDFPAGWRFSVDPQDLAHKGNTRFDARASRLNFETQTPTSAGVVRTFVETDAFGDAGDTDQTTMNGTFFRIRQAYGVLGNWMAGQATTNFAEFSAFPEVLDFNGPSGQTNLRQGQLRYTAPLGLKATLSLSAENPNADLVGASSTNKIPDLTAKVLFKGDRGTASIEGVARRFSNDTGAGVNGWGIGTSGSFKTVGRDRLQYNAIYGDGIGRYLQQAIFMSGGKDPVTGNLVKFKSYGGYVAYQHWWDAEFRSTVAVGYSRMKNIAADLGGFATSNAEGGPSDVLKSLHTNIIWSPTPKVNLGLEYMWGYRARPVPSDNGGLTGTFSRVQASAQYSF